MAARLHTAERALERDLLAQAATTLHAVWLKREPRPYLHSTEIHRLQYGKAGFGLVVKAARALGLSVELVFGQPGKVQG